MEVSSLYSTELSDEKRTRTDIYVYALQLIMIFAWPLSSLDHNEPLSFHRQSILCQAGSWFVISRLRNSRRSDWMDD